jgi:hypothetical protein
MVLSKINRKWIIHQLIANPGRPAAPLPQSVYSATQQFATI